jgi:hypothetical protein
VLIWLRFLIGIPGPDSVAGIPCQPSGAAPRLERRVRRVERLRRRAPERAAFDGGFASKKNLETLKASGTREPAFPSQPALPSRSRHRRQASVSADRSARSSPAPSAEYPKIKSFQKRP